MKALYPLLFFAFVYPSYADESKAADQPVEDEKKTYDNEKRGGELVTNLKKSGFQKFAELLVISEVVKELDVNKPFTCFAPKDTAFEDEAFERFKKQGKTEELQKLIRYHFINGEMDKEVIMKSRRDLTLSGQFLVFWITKGEISLNNHSALVEPDIKSEGGVIHGISKILRTDVKGAIP